MYAENQTKKAINNKFIQDAMTDFLRAQLEVYFIEHKAEAALLGRKEHGECWRKGEMPERLAYGTNSRIPAIICLADVGWTFRSSQLAPYSRVSLGAHGFDPASPEMAALFVANGPAFKAGVTLPAFDNVSVYPLLAQLVGITPEANDGALSDTAAGLVGR